MPLVVPVEEREAIVRDTIAGLRPYLGNLPQVKDAAIREPFAAGNKLMEESKFDEALVEFSRALPAARATQLVALYNLIGFCHGMQGRLDEALRAYTKSHDLALDCGDRNGDASALSSIGLVYKAKGDFVAALKYLKDSLGAFQKAGNKPGIAAELNNIGLDYRAEGDPDAALKYYQDALRTAQEIGNQYMVAIQFNNICLIYQDKDDLDTALKYQEEALKIHREVGHKLGVAGDLNSIGNLLVQKGEHERAVGYLVPALGTLSRKEIADRPSNGLEGLKKCLATLGHDRFLAACEKAGQQRKGAEALVAKLQAQPGQLTQ